MRSSIGNVHACPRSRAWGKWPALRARTIVSLLQPASSAASRWVTKPSATTRPLPPGPRLRNERPRPIPSGEGSNRETYRPARHGGDRASVSNPDVVRGRQSTAGMSRQTGLACVPGTRHARRGEQRVPSRRVSPVPATVQARARISAQRPPFRLPADTATTPAAVVEMAVGRARLVPDSSGRLEEATAQGGKSRPRARRAISRGCPQGRRIVVARRASRLGSDVAPPRLVQFG